MVEFDFSEYEPPKLEFRYHYQEFLSDKFPKAKIADKKRLALILTIMDMGYNTHSMFPDAIAIPSGVIEDMGFHVSNTLKWIESNKLIHCGHFGTAYRPMIQVNKEKKRARDINEIREKKGLPKLNFKISGSYARPFFPSDELINLHQEALESFKASIDASRDLKKEPLFILGRNVGRSALEPLEASKIEYITEVDISSNLNLIYDLEQELESKKKGRFSKKKQLSRSDGDALNSIQSFKNHIDDEGRVVIPYRRLRTGRLNEAYNMIQSARKDVRRHAFNGFYDYDLASAHFNIMLNLIDGYEDQIMTLDSVDYNGDFEVIRRCAIDPTSIRTELAECCDIPFSEAKRILIGVAMGAKTNLTEKAIDYMIKNNRGSKLIGSLTKDQIMRVLNSEIIHELDRELRVLYKWIIQPGLLINQTGHHRFGFEKKLIAYPWSYEKDVEFYKRELDEWIERFKPAYGREPTISEINQQRIKLQQYGTRDQEGATNKNRILRMNIGTDIKNKFFYNILQIESPHRKLAYLLQLIESLIMDLIIEHYQPSVLFYDGWIDQNSYDPRTVKSLIESELGLKGMKIEKKILEA